MKNYSISITEADRNTLAEIGGGKVSRGVQKLVAQHHARRILKRNPEMVRDVLALAEAITAEQAKAIREVML